MNKKYMIIHVMQNGTRRLLTRALTSKKAFKIKLELMNRFDGIITIELEARP